MYYDERRSYTKRIWDVYGRIRRRTRPFTIVYELRNRRPGRWQISTIYQLKP